MSNRKLSVFVFLNSTESSFLVWTLVFLGIIYNLNIEALCLYMKTKRGQEKKWNWTLGLLCFGLVKSKRVVFKIKSKFAFLRSIIQNNQKQHL